MNSDLVEEMNSRLLKQSHTLEEMNSRLLKQSHTLIHMDTLMQTLLLKLNLLTEQHATTLTKLAALESKVSTPVSVEPEITVKLSQSQYLQMVAPSAPTASVEPTPQEQFQIRDGLFVTATASMGHRLGITKMHATEIIEQWRFAHVKNGSWIPLDAKVRELVSVNKIAAIKELRTQTGCGLLDAKNSVENWLASKG